MVTLISLSSRWVILSLNSKKLIRVPKINLRGPKGRDVALLQLQTSSSTNDQFSWLGWAYDAYLIRRNPAMYSLVRKWLEVTGNFDLLSILNMSVIKPSLQEGVRENPYLGRLSFKEEAAGKLRVFAMVDCWTQSIFKPLHDLLFDILKSFPNDSTFNQGEAFQRAVAKAEKFGHSYGFDLSAATDRLPLILQIKILCGLLGPMLGSLWGLIMTERDFFLPENKYELTSGPLRYEVGQPMGALSSWAMLALTHHAIVQYCWHLLGGTGWTDRYEVLGDDIVIFDPNIASKYVELMSLYGVELNMSKSVISHGKQPVVEFAKRTSLKGKDVSPLSLKMFLNQDSFKGRLSIFAWWSNRIESHFIPAFKTIMKSVRWDNRPANDKFALLGLLSLSVSAGKLPFQWVLREMKDQKAYFKRKGKLLFASFDSSWGFQIAKAILEKRDISSLEPRNPHSYMFEQRWYKAAIIRQIEHIVKRYDSVDPFVLKCQILNRIGLGYPIGLSVDFPIKGPDLDDLVEFNLPDLLELENPTIMLPYSGLNRPGIFSYHLWIPYLDGLIANAYLTLRFYGNMELSKYSLDMLVTFLEEVESAASVLSVVSQTKKKAKVLKDSLRLLQFIEKTIAKGFRENVDNAKLALQSSWTQITELRSASPLNWLIPGYAGDTPAQGPVSYLGPDTPESPEAVLGQPLEKGASFQTLKITHRIRGIDAGDSTAPPPIVYPEEIERHLRKVYGKESDPVDPKPAIKRQTLDEFLTEVFGPSPDGSYGANEPMKGWVRPLGSSEVIPAETWAKSLSGHSDPSSFRNESKDARANYNLNEFLLDMIAVPIWAILFYGLFTVVHLLISESESVVPAVTSSIVEDDPAPVVKDMQISEIVGWVLVGVVITVSIAAIYYYFNSGSPPPSGSNESEHIIPLMTRTDLDQLRYQWVIRSCR